MSHESEVKRQSQAAYKQWCVQWRENAKQHSHYKMKDIVEFQNIGIGRAVLVIANGYSFEKNIETIKKYQHNVDIMCVDKTLKPCLENGIIPTYCLVCDANVNYETYMKPVEDRLSDTKLFMNVCANPKWSANGNWKDRIFFVNKDVLKSEREFIELSGCHNVIPAGTNVSNAAIVMLTQSDESGRRNFFGYDKILLIGFDYSWDESYYAFEKDGGGKRHYMKHMMLPDQKSRMVYTSTNLHFSAKWMSKYIQVFKAPVIQCSDESILTGYRLGDLAEQMQYRYKPEDANHVIQLIEYRRQLEAKVKQINSDILAMGRDHFKQLIRTI